MSQAPEEQQQPVAAVEGNVAAPDPNSPRATARRGYYRFWDQPHQAQLTAADRRELLTIAVTQHPEGMKNRGEEEVKRYIQDKMLYIRILVQVLRLPHDEIVKQYEASPINGEIDQFGKELLRLKLELDYFKGRTISDGYSKYWKLGTTPADHTKAMFKNYRKKSGHPNRSHREAAKKIITFCEQNQHLDPARLMMEVLSHFNNEMVTDPKLNVEKGSFSKRIHYVLQMLTHEIDKAYNEQQLGLLAPSVTSSN